MKPPPKPPTSPNRGIDEPSSGRARKDVNYVPIPSASLRAKVPLPSAATATDPESAYEDDLIEDMATPTRTPKLSAPVQQAAPPTTEWQPPSTGPMPPLESVKAFAAPPPPASHRHFTPPPSQQSIGPIGPVSAPMSSHPMSSQPMSVPHATSSARVRQHTPIDAPPYSSQSPISQQHITGPQMPLGLQPTLAPNALASTNQYPPNTGSYPIHSGSTAPVSRANAGEDGMPLGYVVASAFFLAIALVGFGLYLAFEVISL